MAVASKWNQLCQAIWAMQKMVIEIVVLPNCKAKVVDCVKHIFAIIKLNSAFQMN